MLNLSEIFCSLQGESTFVGLPCVFVRLAGCNLDCSYCDTGYAKTIDNNDNVSIQEIVDRVSDYGVPLVELTGGEPLVQVLFLEELLPILKRFGYKIYLETNGTLYNELKDIIDYVDIISMDIKMPSAALIEPEWDRHRNFLKIAKQADLFVKIVLSAETLDDDFVRALDMIADIDANIPLILQPVTPYGSVGTKVGAKRLLGLHTMARECLNDVRIIPQSHKMMELL